MCFRGALDDVDGTAQAPSLYDERRDKFTKKKKKKDGRKNKLDVRFVFSFSIIAPGSVKDGAEIGGAKTWLECQLSPAMLGQVEIAEDVVGVLRSGWQSARLRALGRPKSSRQNANAQINSTQSRL